MSDDKPTIPPEGSGKGIKHFDPELFQRKELSGTLPGDRLVRISRHRSFKGGGPGILVPRQKAVEPKSNIGRFFRRAKRVLIGEPIPTDQEIHERLTKVKALAVLSSDALSSVAYGTEAIMRTLILAGVAALSLTLPISLGITLLLVIVATSYQQTIRAYPSGGGSYIVARENLGTIAGLTAGAALLIDYVLTVAVSIAAGVDALKSAFPGLRPFDLEISIVAVLLIALFNLRGIRESGTVFSAPTYIFVFSVIGIIIAGIVRLLTGGLAYTPGPAGPLAGTHPLTLFLLLSAFAKGCTAMTGTEAISNGVPAFKPPESKNARITLAWMAFLLGIMFMGISFLVTQIHLVPDPSEHETVLSQLTHLIAGNSWFYYLVQFSTMLILFLAANTSYADFPRLLSILARDRFAPRWFGLRGDRLAFSVGIAALTALSLLLLVIFGSSVDRLLPLYAIGVFTSFTLSQAGMVIHWMKSGEPNRLRSAVVNGIGAVVTAVVTIVIGYTKFAEGAWMVVILVPVFIIVFLLINRHYMVVARQLRDKPQVKPSESPTVAIVPVFSLNLVARQALSFARGICKRVIAIHVATDPAAVDRLRADWEEVEDDIQLIIINSPYRILLPPFIAYIEAIKEMEPQDNLLVILPEFVPKHWWEHILHNQTARRLKEALLYIPGVVVTSFPYHLEE
ncbi:MAG: APC family permease [Firmicutes bacterium]|nr:APC family permease [Bacillota bacterium]